MSLLGRPSWKCGGGEGRGRGRRFSGEEKNHTTKTPPIRLFLSFVFFPSPLSLFVSKLEPMNALSLRSPGLTALKYVSCVSLARLFFKRTRCRA